MHGHETLRKSVFIFFTTIQTVLFTYSTTMLIIVPLVFYKTRRILGISYHQISFIIFYMFVLMIVSILGFKCIMSRHNLTLFVYISLVLFLINIKFMGNVIVLKWMVNVNEWADKRWDVLNLYQIQFVEETLGCCGFTDSTDRAGGKCVSNKKNIRNGCAGIIKDLGRGTSNFLVAVDIAVGIIQSLSVCMLLIMKIHRNEKEKD